MEEWARVKPLLDGLYEAFPVWVWEKPGLATNRLNISAAIKGFINISFC
jgi:hypothetical protein